MKNFLLDLKTKLLTLNPLVIVPLLAVLIILLFTFSFLREEDRLEQAPQGSTPTPSATSSAQPFAPAKVEYPPEQVTKLLEMVDQRQPLSDADLLVRQRLIASVGSTSGTLYESPRYKIEYVEAPDSFMVEVRAINVSQINRDAVLWFRDQGVSSEGICRLPIIFYPNIPENTLPPTPLRFNPIPEGC